MQQDIIAEQGGNARFGRHVQIAQRGSHAPFVGAQLIDKLFPRVLRMNIEPHAGDRPAHGRDHHFGFFRRPPERGSLEQQGNQHHEERHVKEQPRVIQTGHHREHRKDNRHRAAQPHPADKDPLAQVEAAKRQQAGKHRQRTGEEDHPRGQQQRRNGDRQQVRWRNQQAQHQEHADLRQPRQAVKVLQNGMAVANRAVAHQESAEIDGENAAAVQRGGDGKNKNAAAQRQQGVKPRGQRDAVDRLL